MSATHEGKGHAAGFVDEIDPEVAGLVTDVYPWREYRLQRDWFTGLLDLWRFESRPARMWFEGGSYGKGKTAYRLIGLGEFKPGLNP